MNQTTGTTEHIFSKSTFASIWQHLDRLCPEDGDLLSTSVEYVGAVAHALQDSKPINGEVMVKLLESAVRTIRQAQGHIGDAIVELGDATLFIDDERI